MVHMNRHEARENAMIVIYQYLLTNQNIDELIETQFELEKDEIDSYILDAINTVIEKHTTYGKYIDNVLTDWSYDRLGFIEKAILNLSCAEFDLKQVEAPVIINEAVELAKKYCEDDAFKLINRVLDKI